MPLAPGAVPLAPEDRAILALESPTVAGHTCKVLRLAAPASAAELRVRVAERIALAPALMRRLGGSDTEPAWIPDPDFDIAAHITSSGDTLDPHELREAVARLFEQRLDRTRPLWKMDVLTLTDGETAVVWRIHHAVADGTTAMRYARALLWDDPDLPPAGSGGAEAQHAADEARRRGHLAGYLRREFSRSRSRSPFDGEIGIRREVAFASIPLRPLHDAVKALDHATLNDAVLAIVGGALRSWIEARHGRLDAIRVKVPVSLHRERDEAANHDSFFAVDLPLHERDPVARLRAVHERTHRRKAAGDAERRELFLDRLEHVSPKLERFALQLERSPRRFALNVSNVPGPRRPVRVLGAQVTQLHSIAEIAEHHALRVAVISFVDRLCFGFCADSELIPDVHAMAARIEPEALELVSAVTYC